MVAAAIATPVLDRLDGERREATVDAVVNGAAYLSLDGFVVAITARGIPLMPNGIAVTDSPGVARWPPLGARLTLRPGRLGDGAFAVAWPAGEPPRWDPRVPVACGTSPAAIAARGAAIMAASQLATVTSGPADIPAGGAEAALMRSIAERDPDAARRAAALLVGRGPGLTPVGDDVVTAAVAAVAALGRAAGMDEGVRAAWLAAAVPPDVARRTTGLSATLLRLAAAGRVVEPVGRLLDLGVEDRRWWSALATMATVGATTGPAYVRAVGRACMALAADAGPTA